MTKKWDKKLSHNFQKNRMNTWCGMRSIVIAQMAHYYWFDKTVFGHKEIRIFSGICLTLNYTMSTNVIPFRAAISTLFIWMKYLQ